MEGHVLARSGAVASVLVLVGLVLYFALIGLDEAEKLATVIGMFVAVGGLGLSLYALISAGRGRATPSAAEDSPGKRQVNVVRDNARLFAAQDGNVILHNNNVDRASPPVRGDDDITNNS